MKKIKFKDIITNTCLTSTVDQASKSIMGSISIRGIFLLNLFYLFQA